MPITVIGVLMTKTYATRDITSLVVLLFDNLSRGSQISGVPGLNALLESAHRVVNLAQFPIPFHEVYYPCKIKQCQTWHGRDLREKGTTYYTPLVAFMRLQTWSRYEAYTKDTSYDKNMTT